MSDIETRYGMISVPDGDSDVIVEFLSRYGEWAWMEARFIASLLVPGARVLDGGAYLGTFGLGLAGLLDLGLLCCVEGNPSVFPLLQRNLKQRAGCPALALNRVLAGPIAPTRMWMAEPGNLGSTTFGIGNGTLKHGPLPDPIGLDELIQQHGPFDLIKLDVEGMEAQILASGAEILSAGGTTLWVECNEDPRSLELGALLLSWRLPTYYFAFPSFNPGNCKGEREAVFPWAYEAGLLVAPRIPPVLMPELEAAGCFLVPIGSEPDLRSAMWRTPRWGRREWEHAGTRSEMAALVGRALREETFESFLQSGPAPVTLWHRLDQAIASRDEALGLVTSERARSAALDAGLAEASALAAHRLTEVETAIASRDDALGFITVEREKCAALDASLVEARALMAQQLKELETASRHIDAERKYRMIAEQNLRDTEVELARTSARALHARGLVGEVKDAADLREASMKAAMRGEMERQQRRMEASEAKLETACRAVEAIGSRAEHAEEWLAATRRSTSWRVTRPIRSAIYALKTLVGRGGSGAPRLEGL